MTDNLKYRFFKKGKPIGCPPYYNPSKKAERRKNTSTNIYPRYLPNPPKPSCKHI